MQETIITCLKFCSMKITGRKFLFILTMVIIPSSIFSQVNNIIVGSSSSSIYVIDMHDTALSSYDSEFGCLAVVKYYKLDLDWNGIPDFTFTAYCYMGGMSDNDYIRLSSGDNASFSADSVTDDQGQIDSVLHCSYTQNLVPIVRMYNDSDTLFVSDCSQSQTTSIANHNVWLYPITCVGNSVDNWISGVHYIGISKKINNVTYLGWIKVEVVSYDLIYFKEYALNNSIVDVPRHEQSSLSVYPNPATTNLFIRSDHCRKVEIYDIIGSLVKSIDPAVGNKEVSLDVTGFSPGVYFVRIYVDNAIVTRKINKQ